MTSTNYQSIKTGNMYRVTGTAVNATNSSAGTPMTLYKNAAGQLFARDSEEFEAKFTLVETPVADLLAVTVSFCDRGLWSKSYTYKSEIDVEPNDLVIVPVTGHWAIGKVVATRKGYAFKSGVDYKYIHSKFTP